MSDEQDPGNPFDRALADGRSEVTSTASEVDLRDDDDAEFVSEGMGAETDIENRAGGHYTPECIKHTLQRLLKHGLLESDRRPNEYALALAHQPELNRLLEPLDFELRIDEIRGLALLAIHRPFADQDSEDGDPGHLLVRRQRLTLDQSLLVAILRQHYIVHEQDAGIGAGDASLSIDDLLPQLQVFFGDSGSDSKNENRVRQLLDQLQTHAIVSEVDSAGQFMLRPVIAHLANPEALKALLGHYDKLVDRES